VNLFSYLDIQARIYNSNMSFKLTDKEIWHSTMFFAGVGLVLSLPLLLLYQQTAFLRSLSSLSVASAIFWGFLATVALWAGWQLYYQYLYPAWARWLAPGDALIYGLIGFAMWWLAIPLPGSPILWFLLFGGLEGILEHVFGVYGLHILEKVPWLQETTPFPVVVFSFFEYIVYWAIVAWMSYGWLVVSGALR
jgi:hypothetical protein